VSGWASASLERGFQLAAAELGFYSAARLYVRETQALAGAEGVAALRESLGRRFPVLDAVAGITLRGDALPPVDARGARRAVEGLSSLLVTGIEADALDALRDLPAGLRRGILKHRGVGAVDWARVVANLDGDWALVDLDDLLRWAGARAGVLTFVYGVHGARAHVTPEYLRVVGVDTRAHFRALIGWDLLPEGTEVYPRWLAEAPRDRFSVVV
jgi:hypothetical protein